MIAESTKMRALVRQLDEVSAFDVPVHLSGETGTGKELAARRIHDRSPRVRGGFVAVNCAALPDTLVEAELFGHTRGAFTGADRVRAGLFAEAHGGTLFLDEVADLSPRAQTTLLRVLQEKAYRRLGDSALCRSDFRVVSASHKSLIREVEYGGFRADLLFRLRVVHVEIPPLRDHPEDIVPLARHFMAKSIRTLGLGTRPLSAEAERALVSYSWPGNVRELENALIQAVVRAQGSSTLGREHLTLPALKRPRLRSASREFEKKFLAASLARHGGNRTRTARALGLSRQGLYRKMKRLGLQEAG